MSSFSYYLMDGNQVRECTGTSENVEDRKIKPHLKAAQQGIEEALGGTLYTLVEDAHKANATTMGNAAMLVYYTDYIQPAIAWRVLADAGIDLTVDYDRNGPVERVTSERQGGYVPSTPRRLAAKMSKAESRADNYLNRLIKYTEGLASDDPIRMAYDADKCRSTKVSTGPFVFRKWKGQGVPTG